MVLVAWSSVLVLQRQLGVPEEWVLCMSVDIVTTHYHYQCLGRAFQDQVQCFHERRGRVKVEGPGGEGGPARLRHRQVDEGKVP